MNTRFQSLFLDFLQKQELIFEDESVLLAVSGGIDSLVMCDLFFQTKQNFAIAHCNFQLREEESEQDEIFVRQLAQKYQVPFFSKKFDTLAFAQQEKISTQMAARDLRYQWFESLLRKEKFAKLATAHHQNDVLETILLNLTRGTGIAGFHGILPKNEHIIRPLLFLTKDEILNYAKEQNLTWREDSSNSSSKYKRNLMRNEVIPLLKQLNPNLENTMQLTTQKMQATEWITNQYVEVFKKQALFKEAGKLYINVQRLPKNPHAAYLLFECLKKYHFTYQDCQDIIHSLDKKQSGLQFLTSSHQLIKDRENLVILPIVTTQHQVFEIQQDTQHLVLNFGQIFCERILPNEIDFKQGNTILFMDMDKIQFPLKVRKWQNGDVFQPFGMNGKRKKISDFLIDEKVPLYEKEQIEVLVNQEEVIAVLGYRNSENVKIAPNTISILQLTYQKKEAI